MDWKIIDSILKEQIEKKFDIQTGYDQIKQTLSENNLPIIEIDVDKLKKEFVNWLSEVISKETIPKDIKSIYFGLATLSFPEIDNGQEKTTAYIAGSQYSPDQGEDWACDTKYFPERRYLLLDDFEKIDNIIKGNDNIDGDYEVLVFNGLINLLVLNTINDLKDNFLTCKEKKLGFIKSESKRPNLFFGAGFDSGDVYLIGELKS